MNPTVVRPAGQIPAPRAAADDGPASGPRTADAASPAVAYQRVLHRMVRRELRLVAELAAWAPPGEKPRTAALPRPGELMGRVLPPPHTVEGGAVWPALLRAAPAAREGGEGWTVRWMWIDAMVRDVATAARQWQVTGTSAA